MKLTKRFAKNSHFLLIMTDSQIHKYKTWSALSVCIAVSLAKPANLHIFLQQLILGVQTLYILYIQYFSHIDWNNSIHAFGSFDLYYIAWNIEIQNTQCSFIKVEII